MTTEYTPNFRFNLPDFRMGPWHDLINTNTTRIDQIILAIYQGVDTAPWENNKLYTPGQTAIDLTDNSFWVCAFEHTSAPAPTTFAEDRTAHPTYWIRTVVGITPRGQWQNSTHYLVNDMISDPIQGVVAICIQEHDSIAAPGTIRDDEMYWTFIVDMTGSGSNQAVYVIYENTTSGSPATNVQAAIDHLYELDGLQGIAIGTLTGAVSDHETRIDAIEVNDIAQDAAITTLQSNDTNQNIRLTDVEGAVSGHETRIDNLEATNFPDAPADGEIYARQNNNWVIIGGGGASVLVSDTPPVGAEENSLWWESDTGQLYILYNDGDTTQWVVAIPQLDAGAFVAKSGDTMTGPLTLAADPVNVLQAVPQQYADKFAEFNLSVNCVAGAMTISLKNKLGNDPSAVAPVYMKMKNGSGTSVWRAITAPLSVVVPSGATLGQSINNLPFRIWIAAFDDAGTIRLAVRTCSTIASSVVAIVNPLESGQLGTTSPPASGAHIWYTSTGAVSSGFWKFIGFATWNAGLPAVGTWLNPTLMEKLEDGSPYRPGYIVQTLCDVAVSLISKTDTALTDVKTLAMNMVSNVNYVRLRAQGYIYLRTAAGGAQGTYTLYRDTVLASNQPSNFYTAASTDAISFQTFQCWDRPGSFGPLNYKVKAQNIATGSGLIQYQCDNFEIQEYMT